MTGFIRFKMGGVRNMMCAEGGVMCMAMSRKRMGCCLLR